jgi:hypothetical protein
MSRAGLTPEGSRPERVCISVCVCICRAGGGEERQEMKIDTELEMLENGIFKGVSGSLLKVELFFWFFLFYKNIKKCLYSQK